MATSQNQAARLIQHIDLTNLNDDCTNADIREMADASQTPFGSVTALCIYPQFVKLAKEALGGASVRVATVVNFPTGDAPARDVIDATRAAMDEGADEIDVVVPWKLLLEGHPENISARVARVKTAAGNAPVKAIIESGMLRQENAIRLATQGAIDGGADFIKTSTGKVPVNATFEAARIILEEIRDCNKSVGFKASGGVRTVSDALEYRALADQILGESWATPETFRIGASVLLDRLVSAAIQEKSN